MRVVVGRGWLFLRGGGVMRGLLVGLVGRGAVAGHAVNSMRVFVEGTIGGPTSGVVKRRSNVDLGWVGIA